MEQFTSVAVETPGAIEILTLNRPGALNSLTPTMIDELTGYFSALH